MTLRRLSLVAAIAMVISATTLAAEWIVDQSSPPSASPIPFTWAVGNGQALSQTVTAGVSGRLREVLIPIGCAGGDVELQVRDVTTAGLPGPTILHSQSYPGSDYPVPVSAEWRSFRLIGRPVRFAAGNRFSITFTNQTSTCGVWPGPVGDVYPGGAGWAEGEDGSVVPLAIPSGREDLPFVTLVQAR